jgi:hypothetical protein
MDKADQIEKEMYGDGLDLEESRRAEGIEKEAPCYGDPDPFAHEYGNGECIHCGTPQQGSDKGLQMRSINENL